MFVTEHSRHLHATNGIGIFCILFIKLINI